MTRISKRISLLATVGVLTVSCKTRPLSEVKEAQVGADSGSSAAAAAAEYRASMKVFLADDLVAQGFEWFMYRSHGFEGMPMVLISMLPELDPEIWGTPAEKFARFGHFVLPGDKNRVLPSSLGMATFPTATQPKPPILTTETCGTCHTGRVRIGSDILVLVGGINNQFDIRMWRTALEQTVAKHLKSTAQKQQTAQRLRTLVTAKPAGFFVPDTQEDARQRRFITAEGGAEKILNDFVAFTSAFTKGKDRQREISYADPTRSPNLDSGHPGQVDASGDLVAQRLPTNIGMPNKASLTDIPSIWMQSEYAAGQWDGSVTNQFVRNLAAQIAVVPGPTVDRRVAHFALQLATDLPAPKFPFATDQGGQGALIAKGRELFAENCADCHKPLDLKVYPTVATDMNRATIMTSLGSAVVGKDFFLACNAKLPDGTSPPSCGNFGSFIRGPDPAIGPGYAGKPLTGAWARAPYLHNGSIPTLRHLLLPATRPARFVVGSLGYDATNVGFHWDIDQLAEYKAADPQVSVFDTSKDGLSNKGHDQASLQLNGRTYRLDWTAQDGDDPDAVEALLAYMKTM